jgi:hypothetical protein
MRKLTDTSGPPACAISLTPWGFAPLVLEVRYGKKVRRATGEHRVVPHQFGVHFDRLRPKTRLLRANYVHTILERVSAVERAYEDPVPESSRWQPVRERHDDA